MLETAIEQIPRLARWWAEQLPEPEQEVSWTSEHQVVLETPSLALRDFGGEPGASGLPLLIVAPEVGGSNIADYGPGQSLVRAARRAGFPRVCVLHWRQVTEQTRDRTLDDSIADVCLCIETIGGRAHVLGICQGGWESAIVAALRPEIVESLALAGSAIDFRAGDGPISKMVDLVPPAVYRAFVAAGGGVMRGDLLRAGFDGMQWWSCTLVEPLQLWNHIDDGEYMERRARMHRWYRVAKDLPGPQYLKVVQELFRENRLVGGSLEVLGTRVDLARIACPVALIGGTQDHISPPEQVFALEERVASARTRRFLVPGGHIGILVGARAHRDWWPQVFAWVREEEARPEGGATDGQRGGNVAETRAGAGPVGRRGGRRSSRTRAPAEG